MARDGNKGVVGTQHMGSALLDYGPRDSSDLNDAGDGHKHEHVFSGGSSAPSGRGNWNLASATDADQAYFPRVDGNAGFVRRPVRSSEDGRRPMRDNWKDPPPKPGPRPGRTWRPSIADEAERWKPSDGKKDEKGGFGHGGEVVHNHSFSPGQGFANGRGKPVATRSLHSGGVPGSSFQADLAQVMPPVPSLDRIYTKQDLIAIQHEMLSQNNGQLPLPESIKDVHAMSEIWKPSALGIEDDKEAAPVPPPPGLISPFERRLVKLEQLAQDNQISDPFSKLKCDKYYYFDHSGILQGPFPGSQLKMWGEHNHLPADLQCSVNPDGSLAFEFSHLDALFRMCDKEHVTANEIEALVQREEEVPPGFPGSQPPLGVLHGPSALLAAATEASEADAAAQVALKGIEELQAQPVVLAAPVQNAARWGGSNGAEMHRWAGTIGHAAGGASVGGAPAGHGVAPSLGHGSHEGWCSHGNRETAEPASDPVDEIIGGFTSGVSVGGAEPRIANQPRPRREQKSDPWDPVSSSDPALTFSQPAPWDIGHRSAPELAQHSAFAARAPAPAAATPSEAPLARHMYGVSTADANVSPIMAPAEDDAQSYLTGLGVVLGKPSPVKPAGSHTLAVDPVWKPPLQEPAPAPPPPAALSSGPAPWASHALDTAHGPTLEDIQQEELKVREREQMAAAARAAAEPPSRKPMWAPQSPLPVQPSLDAIMDDEENAADLEGGICMDDDQGYHHAAAPSGWGPSAAQQPPAIHSGQANNVHWDYAGPTAGSQNLVRNLDGCGAASLVQPPPPPPRMLGASNPAWPQRPGKGSNAVTTPASSVVQRPVATQPAGASRVASGAAPVTASSAQPPSLVEPDEDEHELLKRNPKFREWCIEQMRGHQGSLMLVTQLLAMSSPAEMNEMAQMCLKGEGIGMFVSQFWKMKVEAENAMSKGSGASKKKKKAGTGTTRVASAAKQGPATLGQGPLLEEESGQGWQAVGGGVKAKGPKGKGGKKAGHSGARGGNGQMGGAFALLPMY